MPWSAPRPAWGAGGRPLTTTTGVRPLSQLAIPVTALVNPGPAVTIAHPTVPVSWAAACAISTAFIS